jgi:hypothetical protein
VQSEMGRGAEFVIGLPADAQEAGEAPAS